MKKINISLMFGFMLILLFGIAACTEVTQTGISEQTSMRSGKGRVVFTITDAAADMGSVSSVKITVERVMVQSAAKGWVTVSSTPKTYDLLKLKAENSQELMADVQLEQGSYNQMRLDVSKVVVMDSSGQHEAKLPSNELKINGNLIVESNSTAVAKFDFIADESLHVTGNGQYILAPVVQLETREDADVEIKSGSKVEVTGGKVKTNVKVGMDADGKVGAGLRIPVDIELTIEGSSIKIGQKLNLGASASGKGKLIFAITDAAADMGSVSSIKVTVDKVGVHTDAEGWTDFSVQGKTFDLLELKAKSANALLASLDVEPDIYNQIRIGISKVVVTDSSGEHEAKLPSNELKIVGMVAVNANSTSTALFDFIADESLHVTGNGQYILAPVVQLETREKTNVSLKSDSSVDIKEGKVMADIKVGMDVNGNVGLDRIVPKDAELSVESGKIKLKAKITVG
ncbi:DUF4382 domain-containing protein [Candidatus Woesearchaeota archaeon]|nr:DUF4382 domain-containing protein [Candidatus Woesearchaeota archaeon]